MCLFTIKILGPGSKHTKTFIHAIAAARFPYSNLTL
jgi:hypothetical protein